MRRFSNSPLPGLFLSLLLLSGCAAAPELKKPNLSTPAQWHEPTPGGAQGHSADLQIWWKTFHDPMLDSLVDRAITANHDLQIAAARVWEAKVQRGVIAADKYPQIDVSGQIARNRRSTSGGSSSQYASGKAEQSLFQGGFDAQWELDFFGRIRKNIEAADTDIEAAVDNQRDVLISLLAEVAMNYVELRGYQRRLAIVEENIVTQRDTVELTQSQYKAGIINELNVVQARAQLTNTQSQIPVLQNAIQQTIHRLGVLLGQEPGALVGELSPEKAIPIAPPGIPVGLPSDLLRRRPDIRYAERQLAASEARIAVAQTDLFPRFSLTGSFGRSSNQIGDLTLGSSQFWGIGPAVSWPVFDAGRIRANIEIQNAKQEQAAIAYEKSVLLSLEETENALSSYAMEKARNQSLQESVDSNQQALSLAQELYQKGLADFLNVLDAQRSLYTAQDSLVQSNRALALDVISIYKALGGGWENYLPS